MKETENKARFANIKMDYWFKRSFGSETYKRLLELLLGELLPERKIASLKFVSQEHLNPAPDKKGICVDVECTDEDGSRFVVEMQVSPQDAFYDRAVFNSSFAIQEQMASGQDWAFSFPPVFTGF